MTYNYNNDEDEDEPEGEVTYFYQTDVDRLDIDTPSANAIKILDEGIALITKELQQISKTHKTKPDLYKQLAYFITERQRIIKEANTKTKENIKLLMLSKL